jgi:hypothetical protein
MDIPGLSDPTGLYLSPVIIALPEISLLIIEGRAVLKGIYRLVSGASDGETGSRTDREIEHGADAVHSLKQ